MRHKIIDLLNRSRILRHFMRTPSPQWLIFCMDILIVAFSSWLTLSFNADTTTHMSGWLFTMPAKALIIVAVYTAVMLAVKPYKSIVRLSSFQDTYRVALTVIFASLALTAVELACATFGQIRLIGFWSLFVLGVISFALMTVLRLSIKYLFRAMTAEGGRKRVIVFGAAINSFALATALLSESDGRFKPVLMLSLSEKNNDSRVNGIPIKHYDPETVAKIFKDYNCDTLLFLSTQIDYMRNGAADVFLQNGIKLLMLNQIEEFDLSENMEPNLSPHVQNIKIEDLLGRDPIVNHNPRIAESLRDTTVMVTGAAGSIGSEIVRQVAKAHPARIILLDQAETSMHDLQLEMREKFPNIKTEPCIADVTNKSRIEEIFSIYHPQTVYHAAAYKHVPMMEINPTEAVQTNVFGTKNVADTALRHGVSRFVMISTDKAVNPTNIMGASKRIAEIYVQSLGLAEMRHNPNATRFITTRFGNVLGSNGSVIPLFSRQIECGGPVTVTHKDIIRYFMTIPEACSLVLEAGCMGTGGEIFIFDMGKPVRIYDLATRMISLAGLRPNVDIKIIETGLRPGEKLYEELLNNHEHTIPTHNSKIMIAKVRTYDYNEVCQRLNELIGKIEQHNEHDIVAQMKRIVPEFKSQNSRFESIDSEIKDCEVIHELELK